MQRVETSKLRNRLQVFPTAPVRLSNEESAIALNERGEVMLVALFLVVLQGLDGLLTLLGVSYFGIEMEGNALIRSMMYAVGSAPAIAVAKMGALCAIALMVYLAREVFWVKQALSAACFVYLGAAVVPWLYTLSLTLN